MRGTLRRTLHTVRSATALSEARPAYAAGVRASLATVIPLAAGHLFPHAGASTWMSLGGFNGALSDRGGSYRTRAQTMAVLMTTGAIAAALGVLTSGHLALSLALTFVVAFVTSLLRVWGNAGVSIGSTTLTVFVVSLAIPAADGGGPLTRFLYVLLGGLWAMLIALLLWPLRPYRPARVAVSQCYTALADYVDAVAEKSRSQSTTEWPVQTAPAVITNVRTALEAASAVLVAIRRGRPGKVDRGERLLVLSESADQLFAHIIAIGEALTTLRGSSRVDVLHDRCMEILHSIASTSRAIAAGVESEGEAVRVPVQWGGDDLRALLPTGIEAVDAQYEHIAVIIDRAAQFAGSASVTLEALDGGGPDTGAVPALRTTRSAVWEEVSEKPAFLDFFRTMLSPGSLILRFALRLAVVTTIAVATTQVFELKRGYWLTITVIVILQPYAGVTLMRAVQRVLGTVLGGLLAAGLGAWFHDSRAILVIATIFVACCVALLPINYAAFSVFLTPTFVLLAEAGAGDWHLASTRVTNTLLGGALALLGSRLLWPSPERARFPSYGAEALRANAEYLRRVVEGFDDRSHEAGERMRAARRAVGLATVNAEESLQRAIIEAHGDRRILAQALTLLAYIRRFTASVAALAIARHASDTSSGNALDAIRGKLLPAVEEMASALDDGRVPQRLASLELASGGELSPVIRARVERLARQTETLHDTVIRLAAAPAASER